MFRSCMAVARVRARHLSHSANARTFARVSGPTRSACGGHVLRRRCRAAYRCWHCPDWSSHVGSPRSLRHDRAGWRPDHRAHQRAAGGLHLAWPPSATRQPAGPQPCSWQALGLAWDTDVQRPSGADQGGAPGRECRRRRAVN
jgi:hypothetical protein